MPAGVSGSAALEGHRAQLGRASQARVVAKPLVADSSASLSLGAVPGQPWTTQRGGDHRAGSVV